MGTQEERAHFAVGAWVVYGATGVCQVAAVGQLPDLPTAEPGRIYYTLTPVHSREIIYIPADSTIFMRLVISREAAEALLKKIQDELDESLMALYAENVAGSGADLITLDKVRPQ